MEEEKGYRSPSDWKAQSARTQTEKKKVGTREEREIPDKKISTTSNDLPTTVTENLSTSGLNILSPFFHPSLPLKIPHNNIFVINRFGVWDSPSLPHLPCFLVLRKTGELKGMMLFLVLQKRTIADLKSTNPAIFSHHCSPPFFFFWVLFYESHGYVDIDKLEL